MSDPVEIYRGIAARSRRAHGTDDGPVPIDGMTYEELVACEVGQRHGLVTGTDVERSVRLTDAGLAMIGSGGPSPAVDAGATTCGGSSVLQAVPPGMYGAGGRPKEKKGDRPAIAAELSLDRGHLRTVAQPLDIAG
jgi:hypothetical protein